MSALIYTYTWGASTPPALAGYSSRGPAGVPFACYPVTPKQQFTFVWSVLGNGCPAGYGYNVASTCIYTAGGGNSQDWHCTWTTPVVATATVNGGVVTAPAGVAATVTAPIQYVTVTQTQTITNTLTSTVNPPAQTVTVTSTQGAQRRSLINQPWIREIYLGHTPVFKILKEDTGENATNPSLDRRAAVCPYFNQFFCTTNSCCYVGQSCIGPGAYCCPTFGCVNFDHNAPFTSGLVVGVTGFIATSTGYVTKTIYSTVNPPANTVTIKPTSTTQLNVIITDVANAVVTGPVQTVTAVVVIQPGQPAPATTITQAVVVTQTAPAQSEGGDGSSQGGGSPATSPGQSQGGGSPTSVPASDNNGSPTSSAGSSNTTVVVTATNDLAVKVGAGVGVPLAAALIGLLLFIFLRRRKKKSDQPLGEPEAATAAAAGAGAAAAAVGGSGLQPEYYAEKPVLPSTPATMTSVTTPTSPTRPLSELPPYASPILAAGTIPRRPVGSPIPSSPSNASELPDRTYGVEGFGEYPRQQAGYPQGSYQPNQGYGEQQYQANEVETTANRHEMAATIREFHELPSHYGP